MAVAIFFFISVGDPKHLLSQTQKFNKVFLRKTKKGGFPRENSRKTALKWSSTGPVPGGRSKMTFCIFLFLRKCDF